MKCSINTLGIIKIFKKSLFSSLLHLTITFNELRSWQLVLMKIYSLIGFIVTPKQTNDIRLIISSMTLHFIFTICSGSLVRNQQCVWFSRAPAVLGIHKNADRQLTAFQCRSKQNITCEWKANLSKLLPLPKIVPMEFPWRQEACLARHKCNKPAVLSTVGTALWVLLYYPSKNLW